MVELDEISQVLQRMGTDSAALMDNRVAHVVASGLDLLSQREIPGVTIRSERKGDGLSTQITVKRDAKIESRVSIPMMQAGISFLTPTATGDTSPGSQMMGP